MKDKGLASGEAQILGQEFCIIFGLRGILALQPALVIVKSVIISKLIRGRYESGLKEKEEKSLSKWRCEVCGLVISDPDSNSFRQRVVFHRKMHSSGKDEPE
ncbi:MAG: hypothetical protein ACREBQ_11590 [Nitrososphaerales archaeon]